MPPSTSPRRNEPNEEDQALKHWIHWTLLIGLIASAVLLAVGLSLTDRQGKLDVDHAPKGLGRLLAGASRGDGPSILGLGLLALTFTPIVRVGVLAIGWFLEGERRFLLVALGVLALLAAGTALGLA